MDTFKSKLGISIPADLTEAFRRVKMFSAWGKLRPSCQSDYIERVEKAKPGEPRKKEIEKILKFTIKYANCHPNKYGKTRKEVVVN